MVLNVEVKLRVLRVPKYTAEKHDHEDREGKSPEEGAAAAIPVPHPCDYERDDSSQFSSPSIIRLPVIFRKTSSMLDRLT